MQFIEIDDKIKTDKIRNMMSAKQKDLLRRLETEIFDEMTCEWIDIMLSKKTDPHLTVKGIFSNKITVEPFISDSGNLVTIMPYTTCCTTRSCN